MKKIGFLKTSQLVELLKTNSADVVQIPFEHKIWNSSSVFREQWYIPTFLDLNECKMCSK